MTATLKNPSDVNARSVLLPYTLTLVAAMLAIQIVIAAMGGEITVVAGALTALVAAGIAVWLRRSHRQLKHIRFGGLVAHAIAFVTITTSFNVHAAVSTITLGSSGEVGPAAEHLLLTPWFGASLVMSAAWGIGLLIHLIGAVLGRGWED